jgi:carbonic anhydrase
MDGTIGQTKRLVDGNVNFRKSVDPSLLSRLAKGQQPFVAILTCSDSRVVPEKIFNLSLGDAFVVRVAGNSVSDPSVLGSLEYAVEHLHVKTIVVLGHTGCGAVKAAMDGKGPQKLQGVIRDIEKAKYKTPTDKQSDADAIAESNVKLQKWAIENNSVTIGDEVMEGKVSIHGAMYDLQTGNVRFI